MATNLALDDKLIRQAVTLGKHKTKREAVTTALQDYVNAKRRKEILELVGKVEYYDEVDHKAMRKPRKR